ncbi:MAG: hypothetical protein AB8G99_17900, partial [Planctomycetaceae bacterium]
MYSLRFVSLGLLLAFGTPTVGHADELEQLLVRFERGLGVGDENAPAVADELVEWGRQQNNKEAEARGLLRQAFLQMVPRNEESGWRQRLQEALKIAGDENTVLRAEAALFHAYSMGRVDNRVEAIAEVDKAIELAHAVDADRVIALGYIMNAELLRVHSSELRSRDYCLRALLFAEQVESPGLVLLALRRTVGVMAFFECYEEGVAYAERLQELATAEGAGIESMGTAERLLYKAGRNPEYETRLRGRIVAMKKQLGASRRTRIARLQIQLAGLIRDKSPQEAAEVVAEAIATFEAVDDRAWIVFGKLVQAIVPLPDDKKSSAYNRLQAVLNGKKIAPVSENSRFLGWLADSANIDLAEFYEKQGTWQDAAEWRREETVRLRQWANNGTGNAAVSAQSFLEDTLRARRERQRM